MLASYFTPQSVLNCPGGDCTLPSLSGESEARGVGSAFLVLERLLVFIEFRGVSTFSGVGCFFDEAGVSSFDVLLVRRGVMVTVGGVFSDTRVDEPGVSSFGVLLVLRGVMVGGEIIFDALLDEAGVSLIDDLTVC